MAMPGMFKYLLLGVLFIELAAAANYLVGGPNGGWDEATNQQTWASSHSFRVGDNLSESSDTPFNLNGRARKSLIMIVSKNVLSTVDVIVDLSIQFFNTPQATMWLRLQRQSTTPAKQVTRFRPMVAV